VDTLCEKLIVEKIKKAFPDHGILAEEGGRRDSESDFLWIIDPLDGTTNYAHGFGFFAVSIALEEKDKGIVVGVVYAPYLNECYTAIINKGAYLNDVPIKVSNIETLEKSMLATGFPYDIKDSRSNIEYFSRFVILAQAVRRPGSAAIDLCSMAAGKFDGFWEMNLAPWDTAAGSLIVKEAGGKITDFSGNEFDPNKNEVLATNGLIHHEMIKVISKET
jgi:myo-inositol-1(or 4)-monophosphatase